MNPTELKDLANTLNGIADGRQWQVFSDSAWRSCSGDPMRLIVSSFKIRLKPWELGRTVNGHTLPPGAEWHRQDFTEDMLPPPYRPLMLGEKTGADVELYSCIHGKWIKEPNPELHLEAANGWGPHRTTRPIPAPEPQWLPLGPEEYGGQINRPRHRDADGNPTLWEKCRKERHDRH